MRWQTGSFLRCGWSNFLHKLFVRTGVGSRPMPYRRWVWSSPCTSRWRRIYYMYRLAGCLLPCRPSFCLSCRIRFFPVTGKPGCRMLTVKWNMPISSIRKGNRSDIDSTGCSRQGNVWECGSFFFWSGFSMYTRSLLRICSFFRFFSIPGSSYRLGREPGKARSIGRLLNWWWRQPQNPADWGVSFHLRKR